MPMTTTREISDAAIARMIERIDTFKAVLRVAIAETPIDPASECALQARAGLDRLENSLDAVPDIVLCNLMTLTFGDRCCP
jgi:hypothetical protein